MGLVAIDGMLPLPTGAAEVLEALEVTAEVRAHHSVAHGAKRVLQVGVYLHLQGVGRESSFISYGQNKNNVMITKLQPHKTNKPINKHKP